MTDNQAAARFAACHQRVFHVAVAGNPNCGKTTLFNALTGLRHKVGNYPGVTVEKREANLFGDSPIRLLDLPGIYSLSARSPDEAISQDILLGRAADTPRPDAVLLVVDATALERNLFLASQIIELGLPTVLACNMMDLLKQAGHHLDLDKLSGRLGVPVIPTIGPRGQGMNAVRESLEAACLPDAASPPRQRAWTLSEPAEREVKRIASLVRERRYADERSADGAALLLLSEDSKPGDGDPEAPLRLAVREARERLARECGEDVTFELTARRYAWLREIVDDCLNRSVEQKRSMNDRIDQVLTHRVWGKLCFALVMGALFYGVFALAEPLMGYIQESIGWLQNEITAKVPAGLVRDLLRDGVVAGVGAVVAFFPQICILFMFLALLEDSGYMARAAFLMNRLMSRVGLHGKSFIPLLSSHACAIPGILAARTIENPRDRLTTILVAPLMSCSARLPVYTLLIAAALPLGATAKAGVMFTMYGLGIVTAFVVARVLKGTLLRGPAPGFIIELPPYRLPRLRSVLWVMWDRSKLFLTRAGTIILAMTILLWFMTTFPRSKEMAQRYEAEEERLTRTIVDEVERTDQLAELAQRASADFIRHSLAGRLGLLIEPAIRPLGFNWEIGIGLVGSFAAREMFVSTMGIVYSVGDTDEVSTPLIEQMRAAKWPDGRLLYTPLVAVSLMVFYVLACQCLSTVAVVRQETNSWRWPIFLIVYMTGLAYAASFVVYQVGRAMGF